MASDVEICNLALSHLGQTKTISSINPPDKNSSVARTCSRLYSVARDSALRSFPWNFAKRFKALAPIDGTPDGGWSYQYAYPTDCLMAREICKDNESDNPIEFEIVANETLDSKIILTNRENAVLEYTAAITNTNLFDAEFVNAFSWLLAHYLALPVTRSQRKKDSTMQTFQSLIGSTEANNANEEHIDNNVDAPWIQARA